MKKSELIRLNTELRANIASVLMSESLGKAGVRYQDVLVQGEYNDFFDEYSRKETMLDDPVGNRVSMGYLTHILQKRPKFTKDDEVQTEYIMPATRAALKTLNLRPKFITIGVNVIFNGWSLVKWLPQYRINEIKDEVTEEVTQKKIMTGLSCKIFGYEECHPRNWFRFRKPERVNLIRYYRAIYIPRPHGMEASTYTSLMQEKFLLKPNDPTFQHLTRIDRNYGLGYSRIQPIWDAIIKLRERSDSDHFMKSNFMEGRYPATWTATGKAKKWAEKVRKVTRSKAIAVEAVVDPRTGQDTGLPSIQYRPWGQGSQGQPMDTNAASPYLDGEWLRLLVSLGYSQLWATGGNAGAQKEGSEINLTTDDRADIAEFAVFVPILKDILKRLAELGIMQAVGVPEKEISLLLSKDYEILSWLTWEFNDKAALQQEQLDREMEMQQGDNQEDRNKFDKSNASIRHNLSVQTALVHAVRNLESMPETPVMSSWIKSIAYEPGSLYMTVHDQTKRGITTYEYNPPDEEAMYQDWVSSDSKGGFWWDWIEGVYSPAFKHGQMPAYLKTGFGEDVFGTSEETREFKMEGEEGLIGAGETREPFRIDPSTYTDTTAKPAYTKTPSEPVSEAPAKRDTPREAPRAPYTTPYSPIYNKKFKEILNSASTLRRFAKDISTKNNPQGWSMKQVTPYKISELVNEVIKESFRTNRISFGNSIKAGHPYNYGGEDEYICPRDYKKNIGKIVPLGIYHNRDNQGNVDLPDWQVIGTHEVLGWDDTLGQEVAKNDYDPDKIAAFFNKINEVNWIQPYLDAGKEPPISGAYSCNITKYNNKNYQVNIDLKSMSFVPDANCPWDVCNFKPEVNA